MLDLTLCRTGLAGAVLSLVAMFFISYMYALLVLLAVFVLLVVFHYLASPVGWGDISQALIFHQVRVDPGSEKELIAFVCWVGSKVFVAAGHTAGAGAVLAPAGALLRQRPALAAPVD